MISFILIGRNEARNIERCIVSVLETINVNKLTDAEIFYIDSNSTDGTVAIVQKYPQVIIYKITMGWNAAVARNIGAKHAKGDILFFIDGDMAINPQFIPAVMDGQSLRYDFVTGSLYEYQYDAKGNTVASLWRTQPCKPAERIYFTGGVFVILKRVWEKVGGMDERMRKAQDGDLCMKLYRTGVKVYRVETKMANHYTIPYLHTHRLWSTLVNGDVLYAKSVLYRRYISALPTVRRLMTHDYTAVALLLTTMASALCRSYVLLPAYPLLIVMKVAKQRHISLVNRLQLMPYYILRDVMVMFGIFFFYPRKPNFEYITL